MDIKTTLDNIKAIKEIADSTQNIELKSLIVDLKEEILELKTENQKLKEELSRLQEKKLLFENCVYWCIKEDNTKDGPYCPVCWDKDKKLIRLPEIVNSMGYGPIRSCYVCGNHIRITN